MDPPGHLGEALLMYSVLMNTYKRGRSHGVLAIAMTRIRPKIA